MAYQPSDLADLLVPLEDAIGARSNRAVRVHADETGWQVFEQAPEDRRR